MKLNKIIWLIWLIGLICAPAKAQITVLGKTPYDSIQPSWFQQNNNGNILLAYLNAQGVSTNGPTNAITNFNAGPATVNGGLLQTNTGNSTGFQITTNGGFISTKSDGTVAKDGTNGVLSILKNGVGMVVSNGSATLSTNLVVSNNITATTFSGIAAASNLVSIGNNNFFLGSAGNGAISGGQSVAMGAAAFTSDTTGDGSVAIGYSALHFNTTGHDNDATGFQALINNNGNWNVADGFEALSGNTSGTNNIGIGAYAGENVTTGNNNIDIGNYGQNGDSSVTRIGTSQTAAYIAGTITGNGAGLTNVPLSQGSYFVRQHVNGPPKEILEVGMFDQEDVPTLAVAAWQHAHGLIDLQAVILFQAQTPTVMTVGAANAILSYYGAAQVPIGVCTNGYVGQVGLVTNTSYPAGIAWPNFIYTNYPNACTNATPWQTLMRKVLASDPAGSVFFANNTQYTLLSNFLATPGSDAISTNSNYILFSNAVGTMVGLGGDYTNGNEANFTSSGLTVEWVQTNVANKVWVGYSVGATNPLTPNTGFPVLDFASGWSNNISSNNPLFNLQYSCFTSGNIGRNAWGTTIQSFIAYGTNSPSPYTLVGGTNVILSSGSNYWLASPVTEYYLGGLQQSSTYSKNVIASNLINSILYQWQAPDDVPYFTGSGLLGGGRITSDSGRFNDLNIDDPTSTTVEIGSYYPSETVQIQDSINGNFQWVHGDFSVGADHTFNDRILVAHGTGSPFEVNIQNALNANSAVITNGITAGTFTGNGSGLTNLSLVYRAGQQAIGNLSTSQAVTFSSPLPFGTSYAVSLCFDSTLASAVSAAATSKTTNGFTITLSAGIAGGVTADYIAWPNQ